MTVYVNSDASYTLPGTLPAFADPAFEQQWKTGESVVPNFWGPLENARDGKQEQYTEAQGGQRLVQYFEKARMELTNGVLTNGLLATELATGKVQLGDNTFEQRSRAAIGISDFDAKPTFADLAGKASALLTATKTRIGGTIAYKATDDGGIISAAPGGTTEQATITVYDDVTQHNVPKAFADLRFRVGVQTVGFAISEPFAAKVGFTRDGSFAQIFERRVLTYNPSNPEPFKVEFGNIGSQYYQWRYASATATSTSPTPTLAGTPIPQTPSAAPSSQITFTTVKGAPPNGTASVAIQGPPNTSCSIAYTTPAGTVSTAAGLETKTTTSAGLASWSFMVGPSTKSGSGSVAVNCAGKSGTSPITIG